MKARIKATGEIVDGYEFNGGFVCLRNRVRDSWLLGSEFELITEPETLATSFDWESFRTETAAKLFLVYEEFQPYNESNFATAINRTDELIKQLRSTL